VLPSRFAFAGRVEAGKRRVAAPGVENSMSANQSRAAMKKTSVVKNYFILPCLLLLLNLVNSVINYKSGMIDDPYYRTTVIILLVLFGSSITAFLAAPVLEQMAQTLHRSSRRGAGEVGEVLFLLALGALVFWLYFRVATQGASSILPAEWRNPVAHR